VGYWNAVSQVLIGANVIYNFLIQWFEKPTTSF